MGLELEHQNRAFGKTVVGDRRNQAGVYNRNTKLNVLLGISGCDIDRSRWLETWTGEGTTLNWFYDFVERVVDDINERFPGRVFTFTMDNLNVHKNALVMGLIIDGGHRVVYRAPYWVVNGAMEYVFNTVHTLVEVLFNQMQNMEDSIRLSQNIK